MKTKIAAMLMAILLAGCGMGFTTKVSYYERGLITKSGEPFNKDNYTCSVNWSELQDKWLRVEFNGRVVYVYANDTMKSISDRNAPLQIDLTPAAFKRLAPLERVILRAKVTVAE